ncbi:unnamed protein product [Vitrella brassicaformis CCMP3155]|uniref:Uncharacterized protein n=1 Tax=Vitrella brassicaformis (strain CCMP3155) TaxID=1169540 RepID=A0A0G4GP48_VITBC|nr:unnamed protein product [Vitrella brassicaformis CCMP3155]|eukprot:CEM32060.1 unnamed protein product [Vitrella brassicaformis CCMP3155]
MSYSPLRHLPLDERPCAAEKLRPFVEPDHGQRHPSPFNRAREAAATSPWVFDRSMPLPHGARPSPEFRGVPRHVPLYQGADLNNLPMPMADLQPGERKRGCVRIDSTEDKRRRQEEIARELHDLYSQQRLMTPHQRREEHWRMKTLMDELEAIMPEVRLQSKRTRVIRNTFSRGIVGIDSPLLPEDDTVLFKDSSKRISDRIQRTGEKAKQRRAELISQRGAVGRHYERSPVLRQCASEAILPRGPASGECSQRFLNTHERVFPRSSMLWSVKRAQKMWRQDNRENWHILSHAANDMPNLFPLPPNKDFDHKWSDIGRAIARPPKPPPTRTIPTMPTQTLAHHEPVSHPALPPLAPSAESKAIEDTRRPSRRLSPMAILMQPEEHRVQADARGVVFL